MSGEAVCIYKWCMSCSVMYGANVLLFKGASSKRRCCAYPVAPAPGPPTNATFCGSSPLGPVDVAYTLPDA